MNIINRAWIRGLTGIGIAGAIIIGATVLYPLSQTNLAGHILAWIMAGFVGIKITLSAFEEEESWMEEFTEENAVEEREPAAEVLSRTWGRRPAMAPRHAGRLNLEPASVKESVLESPHGRQLSVAIEVDESFHRPKKEEKKVCIQFAAQNPICSLATVDENDTQRPHVRTVFLWRADDNGLYFVLFSSKHVSKQVKAHPTVELCFQNHPSNILDAKQLRVCGNMNLLDNRELKEKASRDRNILNSLAGDGKDANVEVYLLSDYQMKFWQMNTLAEHFKTQVATA